MQYKLLPFKLAIRRDACTEKETKNRGKPIKHSFDIIVSWYNYPCYTDRRLTWLVTTCVETAFQNTLVKERWKGTRRRRWCKRLLNDLKEKKILELERENARLQLLENSWNRPCTCRKTNCWVNLYRVSQEEWTKLRESVPYVKLYRYDPKHLYPKFNGYGNNGQRSLKLWQLLLTYWLPKTYWNWQEYVVSVMLISVLNIKVTCEWHKAIKLDYKNTRTHVTVVFRVTKHCTYRQ